METPAGLSQHADILWQKQSDTVGQFETGVPTGGPTRTFDSVSVTHAGVYATFWRAHRPEYRFSLIRLIVRGNLCTIFLDHNDLINRVTFQNVKGEDLLHHYA